MREACNAKGSDGVFQSKVRASKISSSDKSQDGTVAVASSQTIMESFVILETFLRASKIIVGALGYQAHRVVRTVVREQFKMLAMLDDSYDTNSTAKKISRIPGLVLTRYSFLQENISKHIDHLAVSVKQLNTMSAHLSETHVVGTLFLSIYVLMLMSLITSNNKQPNKNLI